jgi:hypothetical protein
MPINHSTLPLCTHLSTGEKKQEVKQEKRDKQVSGERLCGRLTGLLPGLKANSCGVHHLFALLASPVLLVCLPGCQGHVRFHRQERTFTKFNRWAGAAQVVGGSVCLLLHSMAGSYSV